MASINKVIIIGMYTQGKSIPDVASDLGIPRSTVRYHLFVAGVLRSRADGVRMSAWKISKATKGIRRPMSLQTRQKLSVSAILRGEKYASGTRVTSQGYAEFTRGENKGKLVHRVAAECLLGRQLLQGEVVHHIDGNRLNNTPENLLVMNRHDHSSLHAQEAHKTRQMGKNGQFA